MTPNWQPTCQNYQPIQPISARSTADALKHAHIGWRVIVISACYVATWIPALANDDMIVIAAAKDRTTFSREDTTASLILTKLF